MYHLFVSHDDQLVQTVANRIMKITSNGLTGKRMACDEYLESKEIRALRKEMYA